MDKNYICSLGREHACVNNVNQGYCALGIASCLFRVEKIQEDKTEMEKQKLSFEELEKAAKPLIDILYKYYNPHTVILVGQGSIEVLIGNMGGAIEVRD